MSFRKVINLRKKLEKKYTAIAVFRERCGLTRLENGRLLSVSPTAYIHLTGIYANNDDYEAYVRTNRIAHSHGHRSKIEKEINNLMGTLIPLKNTMSDTRKEYPFESLFDYCYFFEAKNQALAMSYNEFNKLLENYKFNKISKDKFNTLKRLLRKWSNESQNMHYKVTGAIKRKALKRI